MTREEAIKVFDGLLNAFNESEHGDFFYDYGEAVCQAASVAISALREQEERSKGCEYCDGSGRHFLVDDDFPFGSYNSIRLYDGKAFLDDADGFKIRIKFCPMCGRRLEEV